MPGILCLHADHHSGNPIVGNPIVGHSGRHTFSCLILELQLKSFGNPLFLHLQKNRYTCSIFLRYRRAGFECCAWVPVDTLVEVNERKKTGENSSGNERFSSIAVLFVHGLYDLSTVSPSIAFLFPRPRFMAATSLRAYSTKPIRCISSPYLPLASNG